MEEYIQVVFLILSKKKDIKHMLAYLWTRVGLSGSVFKAVRDKRKNKMLPYKGHDEYIWTDMR